MARHYDFIGTVAEIENVRAIMPSFSSDRVLKYDSLNTVNFPLYGNIELYRYTLSNYHGHGVYIDESVKLASTLFPHMAYCMTEHGELAFDYEQQACNYKYGVITGLDYAMSSYAFKPEYTLDDIEMRIMRACKIIEYTESRYSGKHHWNGIEEELHKVLDCLFLDLPEMQSWLITRQIELDNMDNTVFKVGWWDNKCRTMVNNALLTIVNQVLM
jgi:hypothetical protein